jgi:hypothetical protein
MGDRVRLSLIAYVTPLAVLLTAGSTALAQAQSPDPQGCTPQERASQNLSDKLNQANGVLCPPDVDPSIKAPTPKEGNTPVIPPPGSPGGDPTVQPK